MRKEELFDLVSECATLEIFVAKAAKLVQNPIWIMDDAYQLVTCSINRFTKLRFSFVSCKNDKYG